MAGVKGMRDKVFQSPVMAEKFRASIRAALIRNRLMKHIIGELEMSSTQFQACKLLLDKCIPNVSAIEVTGKDGGPIETADVSDMEIARRYAFLLAQAAIQKAREPA